MIIYFSIVLVFLSLIYSAFMFWCLAGWNKLKKVHPLPDNFTTFVSVIVPARNEEKNISTCLSDILLQHYPAHLVEIIVVDDYSTDRTAAMVQNTIEKFPNRKIRLLSNDEKNGTLYKKQAITAAIQQANGELIITTDADCRMSERWIETIISHYEEERPDMIAGPVCFHEEKTILERMQSLEFMGLVGIGAGSISNHSPVMCSGANLAYTKKIFQQVNGFSGQPEMASGDDTQLLMKVAAKNASGIHFLKSFDAIVYTRAISSVQELYHQRKRWASKIPFGMNAFTVFTAAAAYFLHAGLLILVFVSIFNHEFIPSFLFIFSLKCISEYLLINQVSSFFRKKEIRWLFLPAQLFYMVYVCLIGAVSVFGSYTWKERKVKSTAVKLPAA